MRVTCIHYKPPSRPTKNPGRRLTSKEEAVLAKYKGAISPKFAKIAEDAFRSVHAKEPRRKGSRREKFLRELTEHGVTKAMRRGGVKDIATMASRIRSKGTGKFVGSDRLIGAGVVILDPGQIIKIRGALYGSADQHYWVAVGPDKSVYRHGEAGTRAEAVQGALKGMRRLEREVLKSLVSQAAAVETVLPGEELVRPWHDDDRIEIVIRAERAGTGKKDYIVWARTKDKKRTVGPKRFYADAPDASKNRKLAHDAGNYMAGVLAGILRTEDAMARAPRKNPGRRSSDFPESFDIPIPKPLPGNLFSKLFTKGGKIKMDLPPIETLQGSITAGARDSVGIPRSPEDAFSAGVAQGTLFGMELCGIKNTARRKRLKAEAQKAAAEALFRQARLALEKKAKEKPGEEPDYLAYF